MKRKSGDRTVTVEEFHRECLRAAKLPLGKVVSGPRSSYPEESPEGRGRAEGKDALGPDQGTIKYIIRSYYDGADRP